MKLTMLGTGNALATTRYNTCFVLSDGDKHFMVDGGGGNGVFRQLALGGFDWMDMREIFDPYEKHHSTVRDAWQTAARLGVGNLLLYHTEDKTGADRKRLYLEEGRPQFSGRIFVPEDLEVLPL